MTESSAVARDALEGPPRNLNQTFSKQLLWLIVGVIVLRGIAGAATPLIDDEAYYWLWARQLDWSYLDHPPMIAYLVFLTTRLGSDAIWIRLSPLLLGGATSYALFLLGKELFDGRVGFIAALLFQLVPVLAGSGLLATPDAPLFLAWAVALRWFWQALHGQPTRWSSAGIALGLGLLSKLSMVFLAVGVAIFMLLYARMWLVRWEPYRAGALAAIIFLPVIYWNSIHQWAMVQFLLHGRPGGTPLGVAGVAEVILQQFAFALILFPAFAYALYVAWDRRRDERYGYLFWTAVPMVAATLTLAAVRGAPHGNWLGPSYLGLAVVVAAGLWNRLTATLAATTALVVAYGFVLPFVEALPPPPGSEELYGWREAAVRVQQERASIAPSAVLVADRYQIAAQLAYYTRATIPVTLVPCPNPASIWPRGAEFRGREAITVLDARWTPLVRWQSLASRVEELRPLTVDFHGRPLREFQLFRLHQFSLPSACGSG